MCRHADPVLPYRERERAEAEEAALIRDRHDLKLALAHELALQDQLADEIRAARQALAKTAKQRAPHTAPLVLGGGAGHAPSPPQHRSGARSDAPAPSLHAVLASTGVGSLNSPPPPPPSLKLTGGGAAAATGGGAAAAFASTNVYAAAAQKYAGGIKKIRPHSAVAALRGKMP